METGKYPKAEMISAICFTHSEETSLSLRVLLGIRCDAISLWFHLECYMARYIYNVLWLQLHVLHMISIIALLPYMFYIFESSPIYKVIIFRAHYLR